ncbi:DMT family transporter [Nocardia sp. NPDC057227]|uniref:DMT family transporter n=1 Tax=Nocardia sp. NPDC057227 TaxID=3346056 RepID=UPI00362667DF
MHWLYLAVATVFEIAVALAASKAAGFTHRWWTVATLVSGAIGTFFLSLTLLTLDVGVGYAIWVAISGVGIVILGAVLFGQRLSWRKLLGIAIVVVGVVGLQLSGSGA